MRHIVVFIIGPPGVGKTSICKTVLNEWDKSLVAKPKWTLCPPYALAGHYCGTIHDGADNVGFHAALETLEYWRDFIVTDDDYKYTILDGSRFSTKNVYDLMEKDKDLLSLCVYIKAKEEELEKRRKDRGTTQNAAWVKGCVTKADKFYGYFPEERRMEVQNPQRKDSEWSCEIKDTVDEWIRVNHSIDD